MLKVVLCDDNKNMVKQQTEWIREISKKHCLETVISCFYNAESLLFQYGDTPEDADIIFLDIMMERTNGMEAAQQLRDLGCKAQIVFMTSYEDYVFEAFDVQAVQYLLKDSTDKERFEKIFLMAAGLALRKEAELFKFEFDGKLWVIPIEQISYFETWRRVVTAHYGDGETAKFYAKLSAVEEQLIQKDFVRVHRSFLVHMPFIFSFRKQELILKNQKTIPVGVTYAPALKRCFSDYIARHHIDFSQNFHEHEKE